MSQTKTQLIKSLYPIIAFSLGMAFSCLFIFIGLSCDRRTRDTVSVPREQLMRLIDMADYSIVAQYGRSSLLPTSAERDLMLSLYRLAGEDVPPHFSLLFCWGNTDEIRNPHRDIDRYGFVQHDDYGVNVVRLQADDLDTDRPAE